MVASFATLPGWRSHAQNAIQPTPARLSALLTRPAGDCATAASIGPCSSSVNASMSFLRKTRSYHVPEVPRQPGRYAELDQHDHDSHQRPPAATAHQARHRGQAGEVQHAVERPAENVQGDYGDGDDESGVHASNLHDWISLNLTTGWPARFRIIPINTSTARITKMIRPNLKNGTALGNWLSQNTSNQ